MKELFKIENIPVEKKLKVNKFLIPIEVIQKPIVQVELIELLKELFTYDKETGFLYYKPRYFGELSKPQKAWNSRCLHKQAGYISSNGYIRVKVFKKYYYAHQIAFAIMKDYIPYFIDHKDENKVNNKWDNLREATRSKNGCNKGKRTDNKSGFKGVYWSKRSQRWIMEISLLGVRYSSSHTSKEDAYNAYCEIAEKLHGEFANVT